MAAGPTWRPAGRAWRFSRWLPEWAACRAARPASIRPAACRCVPGVRRCRRPSRRRATTLPAAAHRPRGRARRWRGPAHRAARRRGRWPAPAVRAAAAVDGRCVRCGAVVPPQRPSARCSSAASRATASAWWTRSAAPSAPSRSSSFETAVSSSMFKDRGAGQCGAFGSSSFALAINLSAIASALTWNLPSRIAWAMRSTFSVSKSARLASLGGEGQRGLARQLDPRAGLARRRPVRPRPCARLPRSAQPVSCPWGRSS